ncbi:MAG: TRAP transporter small permease [Rhodobacteraceae bacterium]|jgi:TRAP-type C4-dicarboxylate transport system permease small subunit|nr:TRAP transporter small permease [Paracoccaceae bacterium]
MYRFFYTIARFMALLGGIVLSVLVLMVCLSILGRTLNGLLHTMVASGVLAGAAQGLIDFGIGPVTGDFELVEAGVAFAVFAFLPLCHITAGHASVDIFTSWMPDGAQRVLNVLIEVLFAVVLVVIAVQLYEGMQSKMRSGQTTFLLQFPIWWAYAASLSGAVVSAIVGVFMAALRIAELVLRRQIFVNAQGANH